MSWFAGDTREEMTQPKIATRFSVANFVSPDFINIWKDGVFCAVNKSQRKSFPTVHQSVGMKILREKEFGWGNHPGK